MTETGSENSSEQINVLTNFLLYGILKEPKQRKFKSENIMKKLWKKAGAVLLAAVTALGSAGVIPVYGAEDTDWPSGPQIDSPCAIVMEANTGAVLYEKNADEVHYPASITKIMTTLLAIENSSMDEIVTFSAEAVFENEGDSSHIARDLDEEMTMEQCLYAVMLESANECAYAVAEHVGGGSSQTFVDMMNEKAEELGCTNTHFNNPNGLPDENHVTTCRDMALISKAAIENSTFRQITGTVSYTIPPTNKHEDSTPLNNHHQMLSAYKGTQYLYDSCIGGKTGYTSAAGSTLVTYAEQDGMLLICVIMNSQSTHYQDTTTLFDYCFANYKMYNVSENETRYASSGQADSSLFGYAEPFAELDADAEIILPVNADFQDTDIEISYDNVSGDVVGTLVYSYGGRVVGSADVVTTGASGATYEFGETTGISDSSSAESEAAAQGDTGSGDSSGASLVSAARLKQIIKAVVIIVVIAAAVFLAVVFLYNNIRRCFRKKKKRDRRYKTIRENRKWRKRRKGH